MTLFPDAYSNLSTLVCVVWVYSATLKPATHKIEKLEYNRFSRVGKGFFSKLTSQGDVHLLSDWTSLTSYGLFTLTCMNNLVDHIIPVRYVGRDREAPYFKPLVNTHSITLNCC